MVVFRIFFNFHAPSLHYAQSHFLKSNKGQPNHQPSVCLLIFIIITFNSNIYRMGSTCQKEFKNDPITNIDMD
jgi:hypothetical protein